MILAILEFFMVPQLKNTLYIEIENGGVKRQIFSHRVLIISIYNDWIPLVAEVVIYSSAQPSSFWILFQRQKFLATCKSLDK